jgi:hypothetical protein
MIWSVSAAAKWFSAAMRSMSAVIRRAFAADAWDCSFRFRAVAMAAFLSPLVGHGSKAATALRIAVRSRVTARARE